MTDDKEAVEMVLAITDGPIVTENITIDQRYRFEQEIANLKAERERIRERLFDIKKKIAWIGMNSGIAADGNHVDPIQAHKENYEKITYMLEAIDDLLGEK